MNFLMFLLALFPIIWLAISLAGLKMPSYKACPISLLLASILAFFVWQMSGDNLLRASIEGSTTALWPICLVIIAAMFVYNLCVYTGKIELIQKLLTSVSNDKRILILLIAWGFGGFIEGMAGFGTSVAIPASMLVGLGFPPLLAAIVCLIANSTPTAYGSVGLPCITIANLLGLEVTDLSVITSINQIPLVILTPFVLIWISGRFTKQKNIFRGIFLITLLSGVCYIIPQFLVALFIGPELASVIGGLCAMAVIVLWCRISKRKADADFKIEGDNSVKIPTSEALRSFSPFILAVFFLVITSSIVPPINNFLSNFQTSVEISYGVTSKFSWINTPGIMLIISGIIGGKIQGASFREILRIFLTTVKQMSKTIISIVCIIMTATIMSRSGMISDIAIFLASTTGNFYPFLAPLVGSIGTFVTGSATSSGVLFGNLQKETAISIGVNELWLIGANTLGACAGKIISAQNIAIVTVATGLTGQESKILKAVIKYFILYIAIMGLTIFIGTMIL